MSSIVRLNRKIVTNIVRSHRSLTTAVQDDEEYTIVPQYPPILDLSHEKRVERKKEAAYEELKAVKTVEEKQIKLNMPKYYGFKCYMFTEGQITYNTLPLIQHITRTHLLETSNLPECYNNINVDSLMNDVKSDIEEALLIEHGNYKRKHEVKHNKVNEVELENIVSTSICKHFHRFLFNKTAKIYKYLNDTQFDSEPRIESFWFAGGMNPPENIKRFRRSIDWCKHTENVPTDRAIQYIGTPIAALRSKLPLLPVIPYSESENPSLDVPFFQYDPRITGMTTEQRHVTNIPGFWPGDPHQFGLISYHNRGHILNRIYNDNKDALYCQGLLASFGWLNAQANFLGFTTYNDITYPMVTQTIITNGQKWSFFVYQLNTLLLHSKHAQENPKKNICWATPEFKLYEEIKDGKVIGLNEDVIKILLKFYANVPEERLGVNLMPYLSQTEKVIADYKDDDKREWLEREYKYLMANRQRFKLEYELYHWEKIYKVDHQTRPMEPRRRPFELGINPFKRTLDDREPIYIPRKHRPHLPRHKGKYKKDYFP